MYSDITTEDISETQHYKQENAKCYIYFILIFDFAVTLISQTP